MNNDETNHDTVTRYGITYIDQDGFRILAHPHYATHLRDTKEEAEKLLALVKENNSESSLNMYAEGNPDSLEVRPVKAWRGTGDPAQTLFDN